MLSTLLPVTILMIHCPNSTLFPCFLRVAMKQMNRCTAGKKGGRQKTADRDTLGLCLHVLQSMSSKVHLAAVQFSHGFFWGRVSELPLPIPSVLEEKSHNMLGGGKDGLETFQEEPYCHRYQGQMGSADKTARSWKCSGILQIEKYWCYWVTCPYGLAFLLDRLLCTHLLRKNEGYSGGLWNLLLDILRSNIMCGITRRETKLRLKLDFPFAFLLKTKINPKYYA